MNSKFIYGLINGKQVINAVIESAIVGALDPVLRQRVPKGLPEIRLSKLVPE